MLICPVKEVAYVERNIDLIRDLLLKIEANPEMDGTRQFMYSTPEEMGISGHSREEVSYHIKMLIQAGYVDGNASMGLPMQSIRALTWNGHEFLDSVRDTGIWAKVKERAAKLPSAPLSILAGIAVAEVKKHLGLP